MNANEKRIAVRNKYRTIIGRNLYSQDRRNYCYTPYSNGKYYSDCSSSISHTYKECGFGFGILNTVGMYQCKKFTDVPVKIVKGQITNPEIMRIGDMLLYAGNDSSRSYAGYVGHVEMLGEINGSKYILYGHGSGNPKKTEMTAKNRSRYNTKASTKLGNRGLIKVVRFIQDDGTEDTGTDTSLGFRELKNGMTGDDVKELQTLLVECGYSCGSYGIDGEFGDETEMAVIKFQQDHGISADGTVRAETVNALKKTGGSSEETVQTQVSISKGNCYVRSEPDTSGEKLGVAYKGTSYTYAGETSEDGWYSIIYKNTKAWVSGKYACLS